MLIGNVEVQAGNVVEFLYDGKPRSGRIEKTGTSQDRHSAKADFVLVETPQGFRNFTASKMEGLRVVS